MYSFKIPDVWDFGSANPCRPNNLLNLLREGYHSSSPPGGIDFLDGPLLDFGKPLNLQALNFKSEEMTVDDGANVRFYHLPSNAYRL